MRPPVKILLAENAGFCFGVKRALEVVARAAQDSAGTVYTLGPLIHNPQEIARMAEQGVLPVDALDDVKDGPVVLSAHGVDPEVESKASAAGLTV
ncbi:MAG: bifunctional 4-hydroxy-3-methylbut-2-enyl diphosphate reductase/30S ribosomal protein S1, partial [Armatimonadota bacterium]|nr:bifunctional 4-hydroxy-3-methylbut-2-enyl diphosphate reductase/30S ribosomal protein S1 [Armatimonadota bacterium]